MLQAELQQKFNQEMQNRCPDPTGHHFVVALSGGCDSTALALLLRGWLSDIENTEMTCAIIDHQIRPESTDEAEMVATRFRDMGFKNVVVKKWPKSDHPDNVTQADARTARYDLLHQICDEYQARYLLLGQHLDDQVETFFYRLSKSSGLDGLCAMSVERQKGDLTYLRPLLNMRKAELQQYCQDQHVSWVEDPSNQSDKYARTAMRSLCQSATELGVDMRSVSQSVDKLNAAHSYIHSAFLEFADTDIRVSTHGYAIMHLDAFFQLHDYMQFYVLKEILLCLSDKPYAPRHDSIMHLLDLLHSGGQGVMTLHGCVLDRKIDGDMLYFYREQRALPEKMNLSSGQAYVWDQKYYIHWRGEGDIIICPFGAMRNYIGEENWMQLWAAYPKSLGHSALSIWQDDRLLALPLIDYQEKEDILDIQTLFTSDRQIKIV